MQMQMSLRVHLSRKKPDCAGTKGQGDGRDGRDGRWQHGKRKDEGKDERGEEYQLAFTTNAKY